MLYLFQFQTSIIRKYLISQYRYQYMVIFMAYYNKRMKFKILHMHIWASMKVFEDTEKASLRHQYEFETSIKLLFDIFVAWHQQAFIPDGTHACTVNELYLYCACTVLVLYRYGNCTVVYSYCSLRCDTVYIYTVMVLFIH